MRKHPRYGTGSGAHGKRRFLDGTCAHRPPTITRTARSGRTSILLLTPRGCSPTGTHQLGNPRRALLGKSISAATRNAYKWILVLTAADGSCGVANGWHQHPPSSDLGIIGVLGIPLVPKPGRSLMQSAYALQRDAQALELSASAGVSVTFDSWQVGTTQRRLVRPA